MVKSFLEKAFDAIKANEVEECHKWIRTCLKTKHTLDFTNEHKSTPLILACMHEALKPVVLDLIKHGADPKVQNKHGWAALHMAVSRLQGNTEVVKALLAAGASPNQPDHNGVTPLLCAAANGELEAAELMVAAGGDLKCTSRDGDTPIRVALGACGFEHGHALQPHVHPLIQAELTGKGMAHGKNTREETLAKMVLFFSKNGGALGKTHQNKIAKVPPPVTALTRVSPSVLEHLGASKEGTSFEVALLLAAANVGDQGAHDRVLAAMKQEGLPVTDALRCLLDFPPMEGKTELMVAIIKGQGKATEFDLTLIKNEEDNGASFAEYLIRSGIVLSTLIVALEGDSEAQKVKFDELLWKDINKQTSTGSFALLACVPVPPILRYHRDPPDERTGECINCLLLHGADPNLTRNQYNFLMYWLYGNRASGSDSWAEKYLKSLVEAGESTPAAAARELLKANMNWGATNSEGKTCVELAEGQGEAPALLVKLGAPAPTPNENKSEE